MQATAQLLFDGTEESAAPAAGTFEDFLRISAEETALLQPQQAAVALEVSVQRVCQLIDAGTLRTWEFFGKRYVSARDVVARQNGEINRGGRPPRSDAQKFQAACIIASKASLPQVVESMRRK